MLLNMLGFKCFSCLHAIANHHHHPVCFEVPITQWKWKLQQNQQHDQKGKEGISCLGFSLVHVLFLLLTFEGSFLANKPKSKEKHLAQIHSHECTHSFCTVSFHQKYIKRLKTAFSVRTKSIHIDIDAWGLRQKIADLIIIFFPAHEKEHKEKTGELN